MGAAARAEPAPAKVNLTLRVLRRRPDGYHDIESLVVFADVGDTLTFTAAPTWALSVHGLTAEAAGDIADNLVLKAARALAERVPGLNAGRFTLTKRLPVAAGMGGGSADAAAALRLVARANGIAPADPRVMEAARATGADVPVCVDPRSRLMRGIGDILSDPLDLPRLPAVLVNPGVAVPTRQVFSALQLRPVVECAALPPAAIAASPSDGGRESAGRSSGETQRRATLLAHLASAGNDLEAPAIALQPMIADVLEILRALAGCRLARMSGSGATCFGLFDSLRATTAAARTLRMQHADWWVRATMLAR